MNDIISVIMCVFLGIWLVMGSIMLSIGFFQIITTGVLCK